MLTIENRPKDLAERIEFLVEYRRELGPEIADYMIRNGFCECPASTKYHGAYSGGLFDHCYAMAVSLTNLTSKLGLPWQNPNSPLRVAFFHDLCKLDNYEQIWDDEPDSDRDFDGVFHYEHNKSQLLSGHGEKSVIVALQNGAILTAEELLCIRYHMGAYETNNWDFYDKAIKKYPVVLYTHTADMIASKVYGI
jgi:hypothetical protein